MKVLMLGRPGLFDAMGGDRIQIENTAIGLRAMQVDVEIKTDMNFIPKKYDLIHVFQLDWTPISYFYAQKAKDASVPLVLSPIHHNVSEVRKFDDEYVFDFRRISKLLFKDQFHRDVFKNIYRSLFDPRMLGVTLLSALHGFKKMLADTLRMSKVVLVQTDLEARDLQETFGVTFPYKKIPNGVSKNFLNFSSSTQIENPLPYNNYIICVGRIEPRKNQLNIIKAVSEFRKQNNIDVKLVLIGSISGSRHFEYNYLFKQALRTHPWVIHIDRVPYEKMPVYYKNAKVCVSASWFETTGLTTLEALFCGSNGVASGDRARELLADNISYCIPDKVESIVQAIQSEYFRDRPHIPDTFKQEFTWENAARLTYEAYKELLEGQINA